MVIEYAGIVIRSVLTDKREKYYDGKVSKQIKVNVLLRSHPREDSQSFCFHYHRCSFLFNPCVALGSF